MTSPLIMVKPIPMYEMSPMLDNTLANTIKIPIIESVNPDETLDGNCPIATPMYTNMARYEMMTIEMFSLV